MIEAAAGIGLLALLGWISTRFPKITDRRLLAIAAIGMAVAIAVFLYRGDMFRDSGLDSTEDGCGISRVC